jgi:type III pantothenate kinase
VILAVDAGNSRIKWGAHDGRNWQRRGWAATTDSAALGREWSSLETPKRIVVSNVAGTAVRRELEQLFSPWLAEVCWVAAVAEQCGVRNGYDQPAQLGSDRWAALIAAWRRCGRCCVVVNAGTALTADALNDDGEFVGGLIVPGLVAMQRSLAANTAALQMMPGAYADFPTKTADAIFSGALCAMAGAVEKMVAALSRKLGHMPDCLVSGGNAELVRTRLSVAATIVDNLVLDGLIEIIK